MNGNGSMRGGLRGWFWSWFGGGLGSMEAGRLGIRDGFPEGLPGLGSVNSLVLLLNAGNGVEEELREVTDGEGIAAVDALVSELLDGVGEESVDTVGGVEIACGFEELGSESFGSGL